MDLDSIPFIAARNWTARTGTPRLIVIHSMQCPLERGRARSVAQWFAGPTSPQASAHYMVDPGEVVCGVKPPNEAWHVGNANTYLGSASIGIEQTGYAEFSRDDWLTVDGSAQLDLLVDLVGSLCDRYGIPKQWLEADGLAARQPGITSHRLCSESGIGTDHWDPGFNWPVDEFMARLTGTPKPPAPTTTHLPQDDDDMIDRYFMRASNDLAVYLVSPGLGWRWHVPAGQMASIAFVLGLNKGKILAPPSNVKIDIVEGQKVWVCSPDFLNAIPAA
jgi:hypothetical protein